MSTIKIRKDKKDIEEMFDSIAHGYDFANSLFSFGIDKLWRNRLIKEIKKCNPQTVCDVATGTGKLASLISNKLNSKVYGIDISEKMLQIAIKKYPEINFLKADGENIPFENDYFGAVTIAFGIRNFESPALGLKEMYRVLKPGGIIAILEFSQPSKNLWGAMFKLYFKTIVPFFGKLISGNKNAYSYLNKSALAFMAGNEFVAFMQDNGFAEVKQIRLSGGISTLYIGFKKL